MNIYVSNLSFHTGEEELRNLFLRFGTITSAKVIMNSETNRPRGFAFVDMPSEEEGRAAIAGMNNKEVEGRVLSVTVARERENKAGNKNSSERRNNKHFF